MDDLLDIQHLKKSGKAESRLVSILVIVISLMGTGLRVYFYAVNRSLWLDEAMLAVNIVNRSFLHLSGPLEYGQVAPPGFLLLEKTVITFLGNTEYLLRLIPLLAGIASIPLMYAVARRYSKGFAPIVALGLFSFSPQLIYYSSELKQYSSDVFLTLLMLFIASKYILEDPEPHSLWWLGVAGTCAMWLSQPALFILPGIGLTLAAAGFRKRERRRSLSLAGVGLLWLINVVVLYVLSLRSIITDESHVSQWSFGFMPLPPWIDFHWYYSALAGFLDDPGGLPIWFPGRILTVALLLAGGVSILLRNWRLAFVLMFPYVFLLIASALEKYPFSGRLLLFVLPTLLLFIAEGTERMRSLLIRVNRSAAFLGSVVLCTFLLYQPVVTAYGYLQSPPLGEHIRPLMGYLSNHLLNTDLIYVYYGAIPAFEYYAPSYGFDRQDYIRGVAARTEPDAYLRDLSALKGNHRVWLVFSHNCALCKVNEENYFLQRLDELGLRQDELRSGNASMYLYDLVLPK